MPLVEIKTVPLSLCCGARERLVQVEVAHGFLISPDKDGVCVCGGGKEREGGSKRKKREVERERERDGQDLLLC